MSRSMLIITGLAGFLAVVLFYLWFYKYSGIEPPPAPVSYSERMRLAEELISNRIESWKKYVYNGDMTEEEFRNYPHISEYINTQEYLNSNKDPNVPYIVCVAISYETYYQNRKPVDGLLITTEWLTNDSCVLGICVKSKDPSSGVNELLLWPLQTYWSDPDNIEEMKACALQYACASVAIGTEWGTRIDVDYPHPSLTLIIPKDILEGQIRVAVYDENSKASNYIEMYITPAAKQYIEDYRMSRK